MKRLYIALFAFVIMALAVFTFADSEEYTRIMSYSVDGYAGDETRLFSPDDSAGRGFFKFNLPEETWSVTGEAENVRRRTYDGIDMGCIYLKENYGGWAGMTLTMDLSTNYIDTAQYSSLGFGIGVVGGYENCSAYTVELELVTSDGIYQSSLRIGQDDELCYWSIIYTDLTEVSGYAEELKVHLRFDGDTAPLQIRVSTPFMSVRTYPGFEMAKKYLASSMKNIAGRFVGATGSVIPTEGNVAEIRGSIVSDQVIAEDSTVYFRITLKGLESGKMTLGINYTDSAKDGNFRTEKISVDGKNVFVIPVSLKGEPYEYTLLFESIECERTFIITSVEMFSGGESVFTVAEEVGELTEITRNGNSVKFSGTIDREAAKKYSAASIVFYALPDESKDSFENAVEIGRIKVSTRFEYTTDLTSYHASADTYMFMAALYVGGRIIPITAPAYPDAAEPENTVLSNIGLSGAGAAGAFESNISHIIVDLPISELMTVASGEGYIPLSYAVYGGDNRNGEVSEIYFNRSVVDELDRDINFYISVGMKVYLRLNITEPIQGLTYTGEGGEVYISTSSAKSRAMYAAIVRFFSQRYSSIGGFVLGREVNGISSQDENGAETFSYAENLARLANITYNAAANYHSGVTVILPFALPEDEDKRLEDELLISIVSDQIERRGGIPWTLMYCIDKYEEGIEERCKLTDWLSESKLTGPYSVMYLYRPLIAETMFEYIEKNNGDISGVDENTYIEYTAELFLNVCDLFSQNGVVFMEFDDSPVKTSRAFYSTLKKGAESDGYIYESNAKFEINYYTGALYSIWNFSDKYHAEGWIGGGGVASCRTDYSDADYSSGKRVLKTQLAGDEYGGAGIVLGNFDGTVDLSGVDSLRFTFALTDEYGYGISSKASVVFVIGSGDYRAEYYAENITNGAVRSYLCDLADYAGINEVNYVGVMIYAEEDTCFELFSVDALSSTLDRESLRQVFEGSQNPSDGQNENVKLVIVLVAIIAVVTAVAVILLVRRDREDREAAERARAAADSKNKRSYYEKYR
ncbi:MAG: hypothetical protein IKV39_01815 [Clostridia bacterium]|nr:hypothetical protein [Clostridia bacterium]